MKFLVFAALISVIVLNGCAGRGQQFPTQQDRTVSAVKLADGWDHLTTSSQNKDVWGCANWFDDGGYGTHVVAMDCYDETGHVSDIYHAPDDHTNTLANEPTTTARALIRNYAQTHQRSTQE